MSFFFGGGKSLILELLIKQQSLCSIFPTVLTEENLKYLLLQFNNGEKQGIGRERRKAPPASSEERERKRSGGQSLSVKGGLAHAYRDHVAT